MYNRYFGFKENPFSIAPDPRFLYMSEMHRDALAHLNYGLSPDNCIILLTGEVGTGKTTICRRFLEQLDQMTDVAVILNPKLSVLELLSAICDEFQIVVEGNKAGMKSYIDSLNLFLLQAYAQDRHCLLVIDEAQNLDKDVLEMVRLLTNLETNQRKLLKIFLFGQSELVGSLARPDMTQINQRITVRFHLKGLQLYDIKEYIGHRIIVAGGGENRTLFDKRAVKKINHLSGGIPRLINTICDRSLLGAFSEGKKTVDASTVKKAGREIFSGGKPKPNPRYLLRILFTVSLAAFLLTAIFTGQFREIHENSREVTHIQNDQSQKSPGLTEPLPGPANSLLKAENETIEQSIDVASKVEPLDGNITPPTQQTEDIDVSESLGHHGDQAPQGETKIVINSIKINE